MGDGPVLVSAENMRIHFPIRSGVLSRTTGYVRAVDGVSLQITRGETVGLVGESGCGKSTTGRGLIRLRELTDGVVHFDGTDLSRLRRDELRRLRRRMQIVFQDPYSSLDPRMSIGSIIEEPLKTHALSSGRRRERIAELLALVGLSARHMDRYPHEFSGGQRQRVGIARALAVEPEFIVCDEPVSALDVSIQAQILNLLVDLKQKLQLTYLFIAHDLSAVRYISDRVGVMYLGQLVEIGPRLQVFERAGHPYTRALLSAIPVPDPTIERRRRRVVLEGDVPSPTNPPSGCRFHTRCWLYQKLGRPTRCATVEPKLDVISGSHRAACHYAAEAMDSGVGAASPVSAVPAIRGDAAPS